MNRSLIAATAATLALAAGAAQAQVPGVDFHLGAGIGQSNVDINADRLGWSDFDKKDFAWKVFGGVRMASLFGAELQYTNFGKAKGDDAQVKYKGFAGYGLVYLPLPLPLLDIYGKVGLARINADGSAPGLSIDTKDTKLTYGAGAQLKFGSLGVRAEYEQFKIEGSKPYLLSVSFVKSFL